MSRTTLRTAVVAGLVLVAATPAVASAAPSDITRTYDVTVKSGVLASGDTVKAKAVVHDPQASVADWYSKSTVAKVVRKGVNGRYEMPYQAQGFRCTPTVNGNKASFTCKLRGGDVSTTVKLTFTARYKG